MKSMSPNATVGDSQKHALLCQGAFAQRHRSTRKSFRHCKFQFQFGSRQHDAASSVPDVTALRSGVAEGDSKNFQWLIEMRPVTYNNSDSRPRRAYLAVEASIQAMQYLEGRNSKEAQHLNVRPNVSAAPSYVPLEDSALLSVSTFNLISSLTQTAIENHAVACIDQDHHRESTLRKVWKKKLQKRRVGGLILLNLLAALYGSSTVASKFAADGAPTIPASLSSLVRITSALVFFTPALMRVLKNRDIALLKAGAELGCLGFSGTLVDSLIPRGSSSNDPSLFFMFSVIFLPLMELFAGPRRRSANRLRWCAILVALTGMGVLEEEGAGWKGITLPQFTNVWGLLGSAITALHIFRSEAHGNRFDPLRLNAVQCGVLSLLSLAWETCSTFDARHLGSSELLNDLRSLPWIPLIYNGVVSFGLCSWLELHSLRSIHASMVTLVYTTIPVWGAFMSGLVRADTSYESFFMGGFVIVLMSICALWLDDVERRVVKPSSENSSFIHSECVSVTVVNDHIPSALLVSQLKFPFYAVQVKNLVAEMKVKLGVLKCIIISITSSGALNGSNCTGKTLSIRSVPALERKSTETAASDVGSTVPSSIDVIFETLHAVKSDTEMSKMSSVAVHAPTTNMVEHISGTFKADEFTFNVCAHFVSTAAAWLEVATAAFAADIGWTIKQVEVNARDMERVAQSGDAIDFSEFKAQIAPQFINALHAASHWHQFLVKNISHIHS